MARIVLTPVGSHGDVHPFLGVGLAMARRGHDVVVITSGPFKEMVESRGLRFVELLSTEEFEQMTRNPELWHRTRGVGAVMRSLAQGTGRQHARVAEVYQPGNTLLVHHALSLGARAFEEQQNCPAATLHLAPSIFRSEFQLPAFHPGRDFSWLPRPAKRGLWWLLDRMVDPHVAPAFNAWRAEQGLPPVSRIFRDYIHAPGRVIGLFPDWFAPPQPDWPAQLRMTGFPLWDEADAPAPLDLDLESFLQNGPPPLCFTPGSANRHAQGFFRAAVDAAGRLGRRALLLSRYREHLPDSLPAGAAHFDFAPLSRVLPRCAAFIHHGGIGSSAQGLAAGLPQLVMPMGFDQHDNATRLARLGAADHLLPSRFTGPRLAQKLATLLASDTVAASARTCAARIDRQAIERTADELEALLG